MGILARIFTWWNGATLGTSLFTRRFGREAGRDEFGNVYFQHQKNGSRRWVFIPGATMAAGSAGLAGMVAGDDRRPARKSAPARRAFEKAAVPNVHRTPRAYRPSGALGTGVRRAASTGDYQAWKPD